MFDDYPDILSIQQVCEMLQMGRNNVYALLAAGTLKSIRNGRVWRIPKQAVEQYVLETARLIKP